MGASSSQLSTTLQENLLCVLAFSEKGSPIIRNAVEPRLFGVASYRDLALRMYAYIDKYHKPPGSHLADLYDGEIEGDTDEARERIQLLEAIYDQKEKYNEPFILSQLEAFVRRQTLKTSIIAASEALQDDNLDKAEQELNVGLKARIETFTPGMKLDEGLKAVFSGSVRREIIQTGIKELDDAEFGAGKGEFHLFIAPPKRGKSWWLIHMGKQAVLQRKRTLYLTLELSERQILQRFLQSFFSISRRKAATKDLQPKVMRIEKDELGRFASFKLDSIGGRLSFDDEDARTTVVRKLKKLHSRNNLLVKQFPPGKLTVPQLHAYLDMLERCEERFVPDALVIDYPDYMQIDPKNFRLDSSVLFNNLRGLAVERDIAVMVASKSNREGTDAKLLKETNTAEDYSRIYTADSVVTYSQTTAEKQLGLARIFASNTRVAERDQFVTLISQCYQIGQFCMSSAPMSENYWRSLDKAAVNAGIAEEGDSEE